MMKMFVQMTGACLVLALVIPVVSAQYDYDNTAKPSSAVTVATDIFTGLAIATVALVAGLIKSQVVEIESKMVSGTGVEKPMIYCIGEPTARLARGYQSLNGLGGPTLSQVWLRATRVGTVLGLRRLLVGVVVASAIVVVVVVGVVIAMIVVVVLDSVSRSRKRRWSGHDANMSTTWLTLGRSKSAPDLSRSVKGEVRICSGDVVCCNHGRWRSGGAIKISRKFVTIEQGIDMSFLHQIICGGEFGYVGRVDVEVSWSSGLDGSLVVGVPFFGAAIVAAGCF
ncbi:hypothetical protein ISN44_As10g005230 [Arabidopsis suecica]|uniref:Uncharacterized protein n=1 Tax=Arabidopsis suecica TaxID=45249 RepID=A0A8T1ZUJ1_ARASU|nr:hypothetical protein ISN44_As10g005230 [Arabidopsis suecica]